MSTFDAQWLAQGWLSAAVASGADKERPVLNRTVYVERFPSGVRLVATDSYMLVRAWVPELDADDDSEPGLDEMPVASAIASDPDGRAVGFMRYALKRAAQAEKNLEEVDIVMRLGVTDEQPAEQSFAGMESTWLVMEMPDVEKVRLVCVEGVYPNWRLMWAQRSEEKTDTLALHPDRLVQVAGLAKMHRAPIGWTFGGEGKAATIEVLGGDVDVYGMVMPCRWDVGRNEPRVESEKPTVDIPDDLSGLDDAA